MINFKKFIRQIQKIDRLHHYINLNKFNNEEKELIKQICYRTQQLNLINLKKNNLLKTTHYKILLIKDLISIIKKIFLFFLKILSLLKKNKYIKKINTDIIFICSIGPASLKDTIPIIKSY